MPLGSAPIPGSPDQLELWQRENEFSIRISGYVSELMNSRQHASEEALAEYAVPQVAGRAAAHVLVGGLGMGFTLAAALRSAGPDATVTVAELVGAVVDWNRGPLGQAAGYPLTDPRTRVHVGDVADLIRASKRTFDAILLDVDNGPDGIVRPENGRIYSRSGLRHAMAALRPGGVLAVWSAGPDKAFTQRLENAGFDVDEVRVPARANGKGPKHTIWFARA